MEDLAHRYVSLTVYELRLISYGTSVVGAIAAAIITKGSGKLHRAPYFVCTAILFLAAVLLQFVWTVADSAIEGGYLWLLMAIDLVSSVAFGFFLCIAAMARSRDAFGASGFAVLAFVPIANLVLLFKNPKVPDSLDRIPTVQAISGGAGVGVGFGLLIFALVLNSILPRLLAEHFMSPKNQQISLERMIEKDGVEATLREVAENAQVPHRLDKVTVLTKVTSNAGRLRRTYVVNAKIRELSDEFREKIVNSICAHPPFLALMRAGATIEEEYIREDLSLIGRHHISISSCKHS